MAAALEGAPLRSLSIARASFDRFGSTGEFSTGALQLPQLQALRLETSYGADTVLELAHLTRLTSAKLSRTRFPKHQGPPPSCVPPSLQELELGSLDASSDSLAAPLAAATGLRKLACSLSSDAGLAAGLAGFSCLTHLSLTGCPSVPAGLSALQSLAHLSLCLRSGGRGPAAGDKWRHLAALPSSVTFLDLDGAGCVPQELSALAGICHLNLSHQPYNSTPPDLAPLAPMAPSLTALDLSRLSGNKAGLPQGLSALTALQRLNLAQFGAASANTAPLATLDRLSCLNLSLCDLKAMPPELTGLPGLQELSLAGGLY